MVEAAYGAMGEILSRWTRGGTALPAASVWSDALGADPIEAELRLLALSGQFLGALIVADPPGELVMLPDLPTLALPTIPDGLRPLARRLLPAMKDAQNRASLIRFLAARGVTLHPADWMPSANDESAPAVYAPWRDWAARAESETAGAGVVAEALTAANWESFGPAQRGPALVEARRRDPAVAREMLRRKVADETADQRLRLIGVLAEGLSGGDVDFLEETLAHDRAPKVKALAASLLARLGRGAAVDEDSRELAGFFEIQSKGLLGRRRTIAAQELKTPARAARRAELFERVSFSAFAGALDLSATDVTSAWRLGADAAADVFFAAMIERTGSDEVVSAFAESLKRADEIADLAVAALAPRLSAEARLYFVRRSLDGPQAKFVAAQQICEAPAGLDDPLRTKAGAALLAALREGADGLARQFAPLELTALGLLASQTGAQRALATLTQQGLHDSDPQLDMLRLNAALDDRKPE